MKTIYIVTDADEPELRLVEARNQSQAIRHVIAKRYNARPATPREVADLVGEGVKLEQAQQEPIA